jgi:hypothetical protein
MLPASEAIFGDSFMAASSGISFREAGAFPALSADLDDWPAAGFVAFAALVLLLFLFMEFS